MLQFYDELRFIYKYIYITLYSIYIAFLTTKSLPHKPSYQPRDIQLYNISASPIGVNFLPNTDPSVHISKAVICEPHILR